MTIYKLYQKQKDKECCELGWEFVITGGRMISHTTPGANPNEVYSHYDIELFCLDENGNLDHSGWQDHSDVEEEIMYTYNLREISDDLNVLIHAARLTYDV